MSSGLRAVIFDMDGVVTQTASLHAAAWKETFDAFLRERASHAVGAGNNNGEALQPFDAEAEYRATVDGKPRIEGVRSFLRARNIALSEPEQAALAQDKDASFERQLRKQGVATFASTLALIRALRQRAVKIGIVTSSRHGREILASTGIAGMFDARLDGLDLEALALTGKPHPDMFLRVAETLGVLPTHAAIVEDAVSGVEAGRRGRFGLVLGIDRGGNAEALMRGGADLVVDDLNTLDADRLEQLFAERLQEIAWRIEQDGFDRARDRQMESLFTVGNGYLGVRGALDTPLPEAQPDLFVAGIYDSKRASLPYSEIEFLSPDRGDNLHTELVPLPFPFRLRFSLAGSALELDENHGSALRRVLDLQQAELRAEVMYQTAEGQRTTIHTRRCASLADPHLLLQQALVVANDHDASIDLAASLIDPDLATRHPHLECIEHSIEHSTDGEIELVQYRTLGSGCQIAIASRVLHRPQALRRFVAVFTSRDVQDPGAAARAHVSALDWDHFDTLFAAHTKKWAEFWGRADVRIPARPATEQALRFGAYHLRIAANEDPRVSVTARALTGRAYEGHVFWDTEIFMLPFYLHTEPAIARSLLMYRHRTLNGARQRAREMGYRGACFAWESTVTGADLTPTEIVLKASGKVIPIFTGTQQIHVTADIAYAVWRYWEMTGDDDFLRGPGAEILFETARFWISRVTRGEHHHHIRGVVGPDEYHHAVNDNAYTNWMARHNLERAAWVARWLNSDSLAPSTSSALAASSAIAEEAAEWSSLAASLFCPSPGADGVIEQFEGFFALDDYPLPKHERFKAPVSRLFDWQEINRLKLLKQADVLMLPLLFPNAFSKEVIAANYRYYEPRTDHGSSLSPGVHAAIAARIGLDEDAERYWKQTLWLDLSNAMDNSTLGIHPAAMGGSWQALAFGFLGVHFAQGAPHPDANSARRLLTDWDSVALPLIYRGQQYVVQVTKAEQGSSQPQRKPHTTATSRRVES